MKKICIITGSRADYGLLKPLIKLVDESAEAELQLIVTGSHLLPQFGNTADVIKVDGFSIFSEIHMDIADNTNLATANATASVMAAAAEVLTAAKPDCVIVLGDRFEIFACASAAYMLKIPLVHLHGGEVTQGALDEGLRHAISKLASLHFVSHSSYKDRLKRMGEAPEKIFDYGAPGLDLLNENIKTKAELEEFLGESLDKFLLVTYHPSTLDEVSNEEVLNNLITALGDFPDHKILITKANADAEGLMINQIWEGADLPNKILVDNLGEYYLTAVTEADAVVGNSSSGLIEVPYLKTPTVNIGNRQKGRIMPSSVFQSGIEADEISEEIKKAIATEVKYEQVFGEPGEISKKIFDKILQTDLDNVIYKEFYDG